MQTSEYQSPNKTTTRRLILASGSVYRRELLMRLRMPFDVISPDIDEIPLAHEAPEQTALRLARQKAETVLAREPDALVIGSDQVATLDGQQIGKPGTHARALEQLMRMRGRSVIFHTALCLADGSNGSIQLENVRTTVKFRNLAEAELDAYLQIEKPYDCAGSAKNEGLGIALIESMDNNDPTALTGLPLITLCSMLRRAGLPFFSTPARS